ncbi:MAG: hypothetical protein RLZZ142_799 [Verrucomicrobiota bacterium]|jgi:hypothetical protein
MKQTKQFVRRVLGLVAVQAGAGLGVLQAHPGHAGHGYAGGVDFSWGGMLLCAGLVAGMVGLWARGFGGGRGRAR